MLNLMQREAEIEKALRTQCSMLKNGQQGCDEYGDLNQGV